MKAKGAKGFFITFSCEFILHKKIYIYFSFNEINKMFGYFCQFNPKTVFLSVLLIENTWMMGSFFHRQKLMEKTGKLVKYSCWRVSGDVL